MSEVRVAFRGSLDDFVPPEMRDRWFAWPLDRRTSIKDLLESLGPPHTEIGAIVVNGRSVGFEYIVREGDRIEVLPASDGGEAEALLRPPLPLPPSFVLDTHLGKLVTYLRLLGFDAVYERNADDDQLALVSAHEGRVLLTRDRGLLKRGIVTYGYYVREQDPERQTAEVLRRYRLAGHVTPFRRCARCNTPTVPVRKEDVLDRLEPKTRLYYDEFRECPRCAGIYWKGSHYDRMLDLIGRLTGDA